MNSRSCRWLIVSALVITASGAWAQCDPVSGAENIAALKQQAALGRAAAQCSLGLMYDMGEGLPQDYAQAALWYRKAADQGNADAQALLGSLYYMGKGVTQDYVQAGLWLRKAADQGNADAQESIGLLYLRGQGVPQDYAEAYFWLDLAATGFDGKFAADHRDDAASHLTPADLSSAQERARKWFEAHQAKPK